MKRWITLLLAAAMVLAFSACGLVNISLNKPGASDVAVSTSEPETTPEPVPAPTPTPAPLSKDELLAEAAEVTATDINNESISNLARAKMTYCGKVLEVKGYVQSIKEDYVELGCGADYVIDVYLPLEELILLDAGQQISVVGETTDEILTETQNIGGFPYTYSHYQMPGAYLVKDRFEITGILKGVNTSYAPAFNIQIGDSNYLRLIYFADSVDTSTLTFGQEITFMAKCVKGSLSWDYFEAEIIG